MSIGKYKIEPCPAAKINTERCPVANLPKEITSKFPAAS